MEAKQATLLIVEDDLDIADMLNAYFRGQGYQVITVNWGEDGVQACQANLPDLVILDIRLPDIDGFEVARRLRTNRKTKDLPIIFLTEKRERSDRLKGLELQADDYITKPFDVQELRLRVRNALQRSQRGTLTNPVTGLPEGNLVDERLEKARSEGGQSLLCVSLGNLEHFREAYGFVAFDDLLRAVALMLKDSLKESSSPDAFIGQIATARFLILSAPAGIPALKERITKRLEQSFDLFYRDQDRESGKFHGQKLQVKLAELAITPGGFRSLAEIKTSLEELFH